MEIKDGTPYLVKSGDEIASPALAIFLMVFLFAAGIFAGAIIASSCDVATFKDHYCAQYKETQQYIACKNKLMNELYQEMDKH